MSTLTLDLLLDAPPAVGIADPHDGGERDAHGEEPRREAPPAAAGRGGGTLDELIVGVWGGLTPHPPAPRPMCGGGGRPRPRPRGSPPRRGRGGGRGAPGG